MVGEIIRGILKARRSSDGSLQALPAPLMRFMVPTATPPTKLPTKVAKYRDAKITDHSFNSTIFNQYVVSANGRSLTSKPGITPINPSVLVIPKYNVVFKVEQMWITRKGLDVPKLVPFTTTKRLTGGEDRGIGFAVTYGLNGVYEQVIYQKITQTSPITIMV